MTPTPIVACGSGPDVPPPAGPHRNLYDGAEPEPITLQRFVCAMQMLASEPLSISELCERLGVSWWTGATKTMRTLHRAGVVHLAAWEPRSGNGGAPIACFSFGPGKDAPRPKSDRRSAINRRYRERVRSRSQFAGLQSVMSAAWASNAAQMEDAA